MALDILVICIQVLAIYLAADLVGGIFHWAEDTLGDEDTPIWGAIFVKPNVIHHDKPSQMMKQHWIPNNLPILLGTLGVLLLVWATVGLSWQWLLFGLFGGLNQQAHRFAHAPRARLPKAIKLIQKWGILQDARHHWKHHRNPHLTNYCVLTPWVNPILDKIGFWRGAERLFVPLFGAPRRPDLKVYPWYRG